MKAVCSWSCSAIRIWLYPEKASIKESIAYPTVESTRRSTAGREKLSFGQALFRSVKSTHICHLPFVFSVLIRDIYPLESRQSSNCWFIRELFYRHQNSEKTKESPDYSTKTDETEGWNLKLNQWQTSRWVSWKRGNDHVLDVMKVVAELEFVLSFYNHFPYRVQYPNSTSNHFPPASSHWVSEELFWAGENSGIILRESHECLVYVD